MSEAPDLSVVFPVYNEEENVPLLLREIAAALQGRGWTYEIVAVDDGSTDRSLAILREARKDYPTLRVMALAKNSGQTAALDAAWRAARGKLVVSLDADLQNDPADIPRMMQRLTESGADMVIGVRVNRRDTWSRKMQSRIGNGVRNWITGDRITDTGCSLKLVRREAIDRVRLFTGMHRFLPTLVRYAGYRVVEMPVNHRARQFGTSKYGAMNRAFRGLADCFAVRWMGKRMLNYQAREDA
ncbi:MAG: glycosyltransferase family 2 protein [Acidobacteria bacterium]|nr:glycosyltransferase family 2 protein [Acidobacteriota bacterium]MBV9478208.1 glycosyltransferase family 2 protein [Acidobacteriota bacterium]